MWDLPGPGIEPVSPALAGGFLTTAPPGKSRQCGFNFCKITARPFIFFLSSVSFLFVLFCCFISLSLIPYLIESMLTLIFLKEQRRFFQPANYDSFLKDYYYAQEYRWILNSPQFVYLVTIYLKVPSVCWLLHTPLPVKNRPKWRETNLMWSTEVQVPYLMS